MPRVALENPAPSRPAGLRSLGLDAPIGASRMNIKEDATVNEVRIEEDLLGAREVPADAANAGSGILPQSVTS